MKRLLSAALVAAALTFVAGAAQAGNVYLTGHDPDFHSQESGPNGGKNQLNVALGFVTNGTYDDVAPAQKFLWVESRDTILDGHRRGYDGLTAINVAGNADWVDASQIGGVNFNNYSAIVVASSFGGMLTDAEITALIARSTDIASFVNNGGGLAAFAECYRAAGCDQQNNVNGNTHLFGFLPINVTSVGTTAPYIVTPFGAGLGLTNADVDECCTHNSFGLIGGLQVVDYDQAGIATTLAGSVRITDTGFSAAPEAGTWALMLMGFGGVGALLRGRRVRACAG